MWYQYVKFMLNCMLYSMKEYKIITTMRKNILFQMLKVNEKWITKRYNASTTGEEGGRGVVVGGRGLPPWSIVFDKKRCGLKWLASLPHIESSICTSCKGTTRIAPAGTIILELRVKSVNKEDKIRNVTGSPYKGIVIIASNSCSTLSASVKYKISKSLKQQNIDEKEQSHREKLKTKKQIMQNLKSGPLFDCHFMFSPDTISILHLVLCTWLGMLFHSHACVCTTIVCTLMLGAGINHKMAI